MQLREYLFRKRLTVSAFARSVGYNRCYIGAVADGKKAPSLRLALEIENATGGAVTRRDLAAVVSGDIDARGAGLTG